MKIHKKDKQQQMLGGLPNHTSPPPSQSSSSEQKSGAHTSLATLPRGHLLVSSKDQLRLLAPVGGVSNHCKAPAAAAAALRPLSSLSEEDDGGGGGRVRKKRKKKDKRERGEGDDRAVAAKKHKQDREALPDKRKESRTKVRGDAALDNRTELKQGARRKSTCAPTATMPLSTDVPVKVPGKRGRKPKIKILPPLPPHQAPPIRQQALPSKNYNQGGLKPAVHTAPRQRGRKPRDPGAAPVERKKKAKRRTQTAALPEAAESDDTTSLSVNTGGEDSQDPMDHAKRRSGRQVKRRKYNEDLDLKVVDDDGETIAVLGAARIAALNATALAWQAEEPPEDEANIIEKILSVRPLKKETSSSSEEQGEETEEFYVKYRNFSYLHCKWATLDELEKDPRIHQKIKRFRTKRAQMKHLFSEPDEDLFNPDYVEVDRVLEVAVTTDTETGEEVTHYLVKWCSLSYEEATWELQEDLDPEKIKEFEEIQKLPPDLRHLERPLPDKWQKLERSRDYRNGNQLREYQLEGMNWLLFNWYNRKNCILADEMGLGKTIQSITFLYEMFSMGIRGPFLIIAPLSTITNWEREFRTWTRMNVIVYHGSQISRQMILQYEMFHRDAQGNAGPSVLKFHGLITTFEMVMADCPELKKLQWRCVVIDEAHRLKNRNCKLLEGLKLMNLEHKVLLTGTPLQNSVEELFSLLNFLEPLQFPSESGFLDEFGDLKTEEQVKKLQAILKPMMLRRLKDDVEKNLAPKEETIIEVELTNMQKKYYRAILEKNFSFLSKGANQHNMPNLINTMMELRKCCNHPYLITGAEEKILESFRKSHGPDTSDLQLQAMIQAAGKLVLIDKLLPKLLSGGHKVLVFSQMVRCLDILEDYLIQRRYTYERIDGRVRGNLRQAAIDRFCKPDSDRFVFLLCTRAGGLGINLTAADTCIIFDSDWNPQNDLQAQARCHRIGQSKAVKVYRLVTRNSYEREMFDKASLKLGLDKAVLQDINRKGGLNGVQQLSKSELEDLLKKGAYGALMDEEDEGSKFCEEDIDQILQRRTRTITIQSEGKGSTFAKASFISSGNRTDISLDDPNFWQKWAKIAEVEIDSKSEKESLVIDTPRVRKQTRHYNSFEDDELMEFSELDSDSEEKPCRGRRLAERGRRYLRAECFRVEKNLLIFGWGRWKDILNHGRFKWHLAERDMEAICRALLVYCLKHYKGDDKIKSFIWDLISPSKEGQDQDQELLNHSGLSAPVPRGRKGNKLKSPLSVPELKNADWLAHCNPEVVLQDDSYKKHLKQHCNKVLLRVRMLYYLKVEVLGEAANQALEGTSASKLDVSLPDIDYIEIPASWWDTEADKSLLVGVHKHGYERYHAMRADADLCFLERVGMPDVTALSAEQGGGEVAADVADSVVKAEDISEITNSKSEAGDHVSKAGEIHSSADASDKPHNDGAAPESHVAAAAQDSTLVTTTFGGGAGSGTGVAALHVVHARPLWPSGPALTSRLRRLIAAYQRFTLRREPLLRPDLLLHDGLAGPGVMGGGAGCTPFGHRADGALAWQLGEELRRCSATHAESDAVFLEWQRRWTRREQMDFYRTVSSFGVAFDPDRKLFDWSQFRVLARLERKMDDSLERYFNSFVNMCRTACKLPPRKEEGLADAAVAVEPLTEERAARTLYRIELLRKIREQVLRHPLLSARLQLCRPSLYLPVWWEPGKHDRDLLVGAARHGLSRTDFYILNDPQLSFLDAHRNYVRGHHTSHLHRLPPPHCCLYDPPQPPEYPHRAPQQAAAPSAPFSSSSSSSHHHAVPAPPLDEAASPGLGIASASRGDFLDCPPLDESLADLDPMSTEALHGGKASKDALNGFPFNSAAGGQSMLNSYGQLGGADLRSKLRSDVLVGEQGSSEETGLLAPSVELDRLQAPWDGTDHSSPAHHMFNESDPILGPTGFLEEEDEEAPRGGGGGGGDGTLEECLGLPPSSSPSHPSAADSVESASFMLFKDIGVSEEAGVDQSDLAASPLPPYIPSHSPLSPPDITGDSCPAGSAEEVGGQHVGGGVFKFDVKGEDSVEKDNILLEDHCDPHQAVHPTLRLPLDLAHMDAAETPSSALRDPQDGMEVPNQLCPDLMCPMEEVDTLMFAEEEEENEEEEEEEEEQTSVADLMAEAPGELLRGDGRQNGGEPVGDRYCLLDGTVADCREDPVPPSEEKLELQIKTENRDTQTSSVKSEDAGSKSEGANSKCEAVKTESCQLKREVLHLTADETKPEGLDLSGVKSESGRDFLEAKTEQVDRTGELKEQPKEEETSSSPGKIRLGTSSRSVAAVEDFSGSPGFTTPFSVCHEAPEIHDAREPTIAQLLQEKALYSYSDWPKDRVIINRLDSICHTILKGKWPSSSDQYDPPASVSANHLAQQHLQRTAFHLSTASTSSSSSSQARIQQATPSLAFPIIPPPLTRLPKHAGRGGGRGAWRLTSLPLLQERLVAPPFLPELKRPAGRRPFDYEAAAAKVLAGKAAASSGRTPVGDAPPNQRAGALLMNGWQEAAMDLSKSPGDSLASGSGDSTRKLPLPPPITAPLAGSAGMDMAGILQAGLIHPVTGQIVNGSLRGDDSLKRRRGRRRNVEALYSEFTKAQAVHLPDTTQSHLTAQVLVRKELPQRQRDVIVQRHQSGEGYKRISKALNVPWSTVKAVIIKWRKFGTTESLPRSGRPSKTDEKTRSALKEAAKRPAATLKELQEFLGRAEALSQSSVSSSTSSPSPSSSERPLATPTLSTASTPASPHPEVAAMEREAASKGLMEWLRHKPGYSLDLPFAHVGAGVLHGLVERPKQRRHRCKDPTKLDVNSLTGDERVPVVHRGTGRRLGGAMAPAIKELSRWLDANSEYFVATDWADVVKHSGFLPEGKFSRILTEPVNRDSSSRRRGRRPRSEMPKPLLSDGAGLPPPVFMNGALMGGVDSVVAMQSLRAGIPGIPISGVVTAGFPHVYPAGVGGASADDAKNGLSVLPMMLHGAAVPQHALFSVGAVMPLHAASSAPAAKVTADVSASEAGGGASAVPAETAAPSGGQSTCEPHPGGRLTFNPFLIPGVSHGLLYPHMFLPHGGIMALPAVPPGASANDGSPTSPKRRRRRERDEPEREPECPELERREPGLHEERRQESERRQEESERKEESEQDTERREEPARRHEADPSQSTLDLSFSVSSSQEVDCQQQPEGARQGGGPEPEREEREA
ncbi:chromodomain-helicase-DNA-binding protein 6 isoform X3 [Phycodurus eques]|uniref:chromodomain-helicase-DNA-binding protein 6 isoform X3 n=1 Tax=Phycodurus eques TaxID=693459 RepID=UPI002ACD49CA|nr:chromodomain-helicase-DNA-binding protein 6 isoform X3 [Phycodurus eques]